MVTASFQVLKGAMTATWLWAMAVQPHAPSNQDIRAAGHRAYVLPFVGTGPSEGRRAAMTITHPPEMGATPLATSKQVIFALESLAAVARYAATALRRVRNNAMTPIPHREMDAELPALKNLAGRVPEHRAPALIRAETAQSMRESSVMTQT